MMTGQISNLTGFESGQDSNPVQKTARFGRYWSHDNKTQLAKDTILVFPTFLGTGSALQKYIG